MKAQVLREFKSVHEQPLSLEDVDRPEPGAGEVLIKVHVCGICRTDLHVVEGELPQKQQKMPVIPGHQIVGTIEALGDQTDPNAHDEASVSVGDRVGVAWLGCTCGECRFCSTDRENLCEDAQFTGWTRDGGYAEYVVASRQFVYPLPPALDDVQVAPLLCAGIIGYRCLRQCELRNWSNAKLGLYGFGAAGHIAIQIARHRGAEVYVCTRDHERHQPLARELGATWVGDTYAQPPEQLDASIIFAPAGEIVPPALKALDRDGRLVLGGIHMSPIPELEYRDLYWERVIRTVANNTRDDGREFLEEAAAADVQTHTQTFDLDDANAALRKLKDDGIRGAGVLTVAG